jgi:hypothetical protein
MRLCVRGPKAVFSLFLFAGLSFMDLAYLLLSGNGDDVVCGHERCGGENETAIADGSHLSCWCKVFRGAVIVRSVCRLVLSQSVFSINT